MNSSVIVFLLILEITLWQSGAGILLLLLTILIALYALYRYRVTRLVELERIRTRIAADLHDDIGASLSQIAILSEVLHRQVGHHDQNVCHNLHAMARVSREAVDSMSDIVWAVNPQQDYLRNLIHRMRRFAGELLPASQIEFSFRAPAEDRKLKLNAELRRQVFLVFKEALNNVVRHACCTRVEIELRIERRQLILTIQDNGSGFDAENAEQTGEGNGLASLHRRAESIGGTLAITSREGGGTAVSLRVRLRHHRWAVFRQKLVNVFRASRLTPRSAAVRRLAIPYVNRGVISTTRIHKLPHHNQTELSVKRGYEKSLKGTT